MVFQQKIRGKTLQTEGHYLGPREIAAAAATTATTQKGLFGNNLYILPYTTDI